MVVEQPTSWGGRRWTALLFCGLLLHTIAFFTSDLGLDAHVRLNALNDGSSPGQDLPWGDLRLSGDEQQTPENAGAYDGYIPPWATSEFSMKASAFFGVVLLALLVSITPRWEEGCDRFDLRWGALVLVSPVLLFSASRGYDEGMLAVLLGLSTFGFYFNHGEKPSQQRLHVLLMATSVLLVLGWKGFSVSASLGAWLLVVAIGFAWVQLNDALLKRTMTPFTQRPWMVAVLVSLTVYIAIVLFGLMSDSGTFSVISEQPLTYLLATGFAIFDSVGLYLLIGFALWPILRHRWTGLRALQGPGITLLVGFTAGVLTGIVAYIAALWTLEASLWGRTLPEIMVILGNNGRYATALLLPLMFILRWAEVGEDKAASPRFMQVGLVVLVPFLLFTSLVGHQIWSDDAGASLASAWESDDESFLLVSPETLAMHHLYVLKSAVDLDGSKDIDGYWRTADEVDAFLGSHHVDFILLAPGATLDINEQAWSLVDGEDVPVHVPVGIQSGSWSIHRSMT